MAPAWRNFKNIFFTICTWPNRPVGAKILSEFQFEGKTDVWISQVWRVKSKVLLMSKVFWGAKCESAHIWFLVRPCANLISCWASAALAAEAQLSPVVPPTLLTEQLTEISWAKFPVLGQLGSKRKFHQFFSSSSIFMFSWTEKIVVFALKSFII